MRLEPKGLTNGRVLTNYQYLASVPGYQTAVSTSSLKEAKDVQAELAKGDIRYLVQWGAIGASVDKLINDQLKEGKADTLQETQTYRIVRFRTLPPVPTTSTPAPATSAPAGDKKPS
jgi:hypothetical protein